MNEFFELTGGRPNRPTEPSKQTKKQKLRDEEFGALTKFGFSASTV
jgi:hypothetical protein